MSAQPALLKVRYSCLPNVLSHLIVTIILQARYYCHLLTDGDTISEKEKGRARICTGVCLSPIRCSVFMDPFLQCFSCPAFSAALISLARDQPPNSFLRIIIHCDETFITTATVYWRNIYSLSNFNRCPFVITRDCQFFNWKGHARARFPSGRTVALSSFGKSLPYSLVGFRHLHPVPRREEESNANGDEMNEKWNIPFALNIQSDEIKWRKVFCLAKPPCMKPINQ